MTQINPLELLNALDITGCTQAEQVHGSWDTSIWKVTRGAETFALRLFRPGNPDWATHEAAMMRAAAQDGVNVPAIHAEGSWNGRSAMLLEWCEGRTLMQEIRARPWALRRLGYEFGQQQSRLHTIEVSQSPERELDWAFRFGPVDDELRSRLRAVNKNGNRLLHLDYHPLNVMVSKRGVGCVLDWSNATHGEPRADVARTWSILRLMPLSPGRAEPVTEAARRLLTAGWLRGYQDAAGQLRDMDMFKVWAGEAMVHDLQRKVDQPENWIAQSHVDGIQRRVDELRRQAGLS